MSDIHLPSNIKMTFPEGKDKLMHFQVLLAPDEGIYRCVARGSDRAAGGDRMDRDRRRAGGPHATSPSRAPRRRGGKFLFDFVIPPGYPHDAPKVKCQTAVRLAALRAAAAAPPPPPAPRQLRMAERRTPPRQHIAPRPPPPCPTPPPHQVYHPNIDMEGNICLNILREDWKPVLSISSIIYGLQFLFLVGGTAPPWAGAARAQPADGARHRAWCGTGRGTSRAAGAQSGARGRHAGVAWPAVLWVPTWALAAGAGVQDPNPEDPLNKDAAAKFQDNQRSFEVGALPTRRLPRCLPPAAGTPAWQPSPPPLQAAPRTPCQCQHPPSHCPPLLWACCSQ